MIAAQPAARSRTRYLPLLEVEPGMVLGAPVSVVRQGILRFSLPAGHALTQDNLNQLTVHAAEFVFVIEADIRSDEQVAVDAALAASRTMQIFEGADLTDPVMAALFDQILLHRSA